MEEERRVLGVYLECPKCGSINIRKRPTWKKVIWASLIFIIFLLLSIFAPSSFGDSMIAGINAFIVWFLLYTIIAILQVSGGNNICRDCKHRWR